MKIPFREVIVDRARAEMHAFEGKFSNFKPSQHVRDKTYIFINGRNPKNPNGLFFFKLRPSKTKKKKNTYNPRYLIGRV